MDPTLTRAHELARALHKGQVDKGGLPYLLHVERVAQRVLDGGGNIAQQIAACLHDAVEDGRLTVDELYALDIPTSSKLIVIALTQGPEESREAYISRVCSCPSAPLVKLCDIADNSDPDRLSKLDQKTRQRLTAKYERDVQQMRQLGFETQ